MTTITYPHVITCKTKQPIKKQMNKASIQYVKNAKQFSGLKPFIHSSEGKKEKELEYKITYYEKIMKVPHPTAVTATTMSVATNSYQKLVSKIKISYFKCLNTYRLCKWQQQQYERYFLLSQYQTAAEKVSVIKHSSSQVKKRM